MNLLGRDTQAAAPGGPRGSRRLGSAVPGLARRPRRGLRESSCRAWANADLHLSACHPAEMPAKFEAPNGTLTWGFEKR